MSLFSGIGCAIVGILAYYRARRSIWLKLTVLLSFVAALTGLIGMASFGGMNREFNDFGVLRKYAFGPGFSLAIVNWLFHMASIGVYIWALWSVPAAASAAPPPPPLPPQDPALSAV